MVKIPPPTGFWERIRKSKQMTIITANMYKVISSTTHCLHLPNNPLLIQVLLSPFCRCTEKLINLSKVTQPIRSWVELAIKPLESRLCSRAQDRLLACLWESIYDSQWKSKCSANGRQKWSSRVA